MILIFIKYILKTKIKGRILKECRFKMNLWSVGIRERHWDRMSEIIQVDIKPQEETSLMNMVEIGLSEAKVIEK